MGKSSGERIAPGVRRIDPCHSSDWEDIVRTFPSATIFHNAAWLRVLADSYGYTPYFLVTDDAENRTALCLAEINSWITGLRAVSLPFSDECGMLGQEAGFSKMLAVAKEIGQKRAWRSVEIRGVPDEIKSAFVLFYGHRLDLRAGLESLLQGVESSVRRAIRKAEKSNVKVFISQDVSATREYFKLHCLTRRKHGGPPQPLSFFLNIHRHIVSAGLGFVALAKLEGRAVAGAMFFNYRGKSIFKYGASDPGADSLRPSNLVMWKAIEELKGAGCNELSLGRTSLSNDGLRRYKLGWVTSETVIRYLNWDCHKSRFVTMKDRSSGRYNAIFQRCPLAVTRLIGKILYRHLG